METTKLSSIYKDSYFKKKKKEIIVIYYSKKDISSDNIEAFNSDIDDLQKSLRKDYYLILLPSNDDKWNIELLVNKDNVKTLLKIKERLELNYLAKRLNSLDE